MKKVGLGLKAQIEAEKKAATVTSPAKHGKRGGREGKKALIAYFTPEVSKAIGILAINEDTTIQALIGEAIDLLMESRGKHRFGER
jgi:hypothetical protein